MTSMRLLASAAMLLGLSACAVPSPQQKRMLDSTVGRSEMDLIRLYGVPNRTFTTNGHTFLAFVQHQTDYDPGFGGGWGWGGGFGGPWGGGFGGFGGPWGGGFGGPYGGWGGYGGGVYSTSCTTTFEVVGDRVASWSLRGDGC